MSENFENALRASLDELDIDLPHELWTLIAWLEEKGHRHETPAGLPFLAVMPVDASGQLWSHVYFEGPPDLVRFWFGKQGLEKSVIPFIHCGADGSYIALWRHAGSPDRFVFLGSEGEAFVMAETPAKLITIVTMGYPSIEGRDVLSMPPDQVWSDFDEDAPWPEPAELKGWASSQFGLDYPMTASELLPHPQATDPFAAFAASETQ